LLNEHTTNVPDPDEHGNNNTKNNNKTMLKIVEVLMAIRITLGTPLISL
jgi:hypothetical protein